MSPTPSLAYSDVRNVNLGPLREAVREWGKLPEELRKSITSFNRTVSGPLESSDWKGDAAEAAFKKFRHIRSQMTEAAGEAENIGTVMSEALKAFEGAQEDLKRIEKAVSAKLPDGSESWLKVNPEEGVVYLQSPDGKPVTPGQQKAYHETIVSYNNRIREILENAAIADKRLKTALQIDPEGKGFNDDIAAHLKDVDKETKEDVDAALKLAQDKGPEMSEKELSRLNGLLAKNAKNADFAEQFTLGMGPKGSIDFWYNMAKPRTEDRGPSGSVRVDWTKGEAARRAALQDNLGVVMGLASNSNSPEMTQWKKDMLDISMDRIHADEAKGKPYASQGPYNAQVLSNLMRTGKWDSNFLNSYGDKLLDKDQEKAVHNMKNDPPSKWISGGLSDSAFLNFGAKNDAGEDPVTGLMEALNHNPDASTEFFKDEDHFDYLTRERDWPADGEIADEGKLKDVKGGHQSLAHALTAATTGHEWDAPLAHPPNHTKDQAHVMSELVKGVASKDDHIKLEAGMHSPLGRAAAEYTPDFFRAMKDGSEDTKLFPLQGAQADMNHVDATRFMLRLGQDPDANAALTQAQKLYTAETLEHHLAGDLPAGQKYDASPKETVQEILRASGETSGTLAIGRQEALIGPAVVRDAQFESSTLSARLWSNTGFATAVIPATVKWMSPVGGAALGTIVTGGEGAAAYDIDAMISRSESIDKADVASQIYDRAQKRDIQQNEAILEAIEKTYNVDTSNTWAEIYSKEGYNEAVTRVGRTAPFLDSIDQVKSLPVDRPDS
ncbi:PPE domain-containing protein [Streptomyces spirodelae]|uniref:PPE domain-containing protein n=1 Tax=Streptomyces spirodelae TaxID=2812904 RepID=A0ABS3X1S1_9ACTN|nr:PPE domain-containing protein [Streptomyces spirodelae]MBO8189301.1 PPE domain-containing protein [Streptomyces spirodelae]